MKRILVAVDDSAPALAAVAAAIELATLADATIHLVTVAGPGVDTPVLRHAADLASRAGLAPVSSVVDGGQAFEALLGAAREWGADLIVMGRSDRRRPGLPYVGSQTEHLLEFTTVPVLVVPPPAPA